MKPDLLHVNQVFLPGLAAARLSRTHPTVVTAHTPALAIEMSTKGRVLETFSKPSVDQWVTLSDANRELLHRNRGVARERITVIPPGLPVDRFDSFPGRDTAASALGVDPQRVIVGAVGRLSEQKRHDVLIEAFSLAAREMPGLTLVIIGDGELRDRTHALAQEQAAGNVHLVGHRSDVVRLLPAFDVFAMSSDFEGLPFALLEAMATGRAIVTTDVQGAGEAVRHEREGLLVPRRDPVALADAIVRLVRDRALAERLGQAAHRRFEAEFTADLMTDRTEALYLELLAGGKGRR